jgi:hypothetical protein
VVHFLINPQHAGRRLDAPGDAVSGAENAGDHVRARAAVGGECSAPALPRHLFACVYIVTLLMSCRRRGTPAPGLGLLALAVAAACVLAVPAGTPSAWAREHSVAGPARTSLRHVAWMPGFAAPGTPARLDKVGVLKIGSPRARNVLVFEPGTSAGSTYIVPLAQWLVSRLPGWQVWSLERRQNLLEDQSLLTLAKKGRASAKRVFDYYLGWLSDKRITHHIAFIPDAQVAFAKNWGLNVAMQDLRVVIRAARRLGGKVVLSGHSLGGALVTAYATWNFHGHPGADDLAGLVFDDGASFGSAVSAAAARQVLGALLKPSASPWGGVTGSGSSGASIPTPLLGLFSTTGALSALQQPGTPVPAAVTAILPPSLKPPVPLTYRALFAFNTDVHTSPLGHAGDFAILAHEGKGISAHAVGGVHGWDATGALTPPQRWARMLAGPAVAGADGVEWYFPFRLSLDIFDSLANGNANAAQRVLGVHATMGKRLPHRLLMYAFGAAGGKSIEQATIALARQSRIPMANLTLVSRAGSYAHNDPAGAYPRDAFFTGLVHFLGTVGARG